MKIKNTTTHSRRDKNKNEIRVLRFEEEKTGLSFTVHRHVHYPGTWLVSCGEYLDKTDLHTDDIFEAVNKAKQVIISTYKKKIDEMQKTIDELERFSVRKEDLQQCIS